MYGPKRTNRPWTADEDARLKALAASGLAYQIADEMKRSISTVWSKAKQAGVDIKVERKAAKRIVVSSRIEETIRKAVRAGEAEKAMADYQKTQRDIDDNRKRLKAAREADAADKNRLSA